MALAAFFSLTLALSVVALVLLLVTKRYEMNTGRVVFGRLRPYAGRFFHHALLVVERGIPSALYRMVARVAHAVRTRIQQVLARAILLFEFYLERTLHIVRRTSHIPRGEGPASQFLQEVAAHKQKILRRSSRNRVILEE